MYNKDATHLYNVIEKSINIEWILNAIISQRYFGVIKLPFLLEVLYDQNFSFGLKIHIFEKLYPSFNEMEKLRRLNNIRNYFAHCGKEIYNFKNESKISDPKKLKNELDFVKLYNEFCKIEPVVNENLFEILKELKVKFLE